MNSSQLLSQNLARDLLCRQRLCSEGPTGPTGPSGAEAIQLGNTVLVDAVFGSDTLGVRQGRPFLTIPAALAAAQSGDTIFLYPGTYTLTNGVTIPDNTCLRGFNIQTVTLRMTPSAPGVYTAVTMGENSRLEDLTITMTTSSNGVSLRGIYFPNNTTLTAKVRTCVCNVTSTGTDSSNIYGVYSDGINVNPTASRSFNVIQRLTTNVTSSTTGIVRGWYITGSVQFSVRDTVIFATGTGGASNVIGVESTNTSSLVILKASSISGSTHDIQQPALATSDDPVIRLFGVDLANANTNARGFGVNLSPNQLIFTVLGNIADGTYYLTPGSTQGSSLISTVFSIPFVQKTILFGILAYTQSTLAAGDSFQIKIFNTTTPTVGGSGTQVNNTITLSPTTSMVRSQNFSSTLDPTVPNYLQIQIVSNGLGTGYTNNAIFLTLSCY